MTTNSEKRETLSVSRWGGRLRRPKEPRIRSGSRSSQRNEQILGVNGAAQHNIWRICNQPCKGNKTDQDAVRDTV